MVGEIWKKVCGVLMDVVLLCEMVNEGNEWVDVWVLFLDEGEIEGEERGGLFVLNLKKEGMVVLKQILKGVLVLKGEEGSDGDLKRGLR